MSKESSFRIALRRGAAAAFAALACAVSAPVLAATATLTGVSTNSCTYSLVNVGGNGDITVTCTGATGPGTLSFSPTSYSVNTNASVDVNVTRTGGSTGAVSALITTGGTGGCTIPGANTVNFADGDTNTKTVSVLAGPAPGSCTLAGTGTGAAFSGSGSITINDPTAPGTFSFQSASSNATPNVAHAIRIVRTGGSFGAYAVNYNQVVDPLLTGYTNATPSPINFASGETFKDISITNTGTTAGVVNFELQGATGTPNVAATGTHILTVALASNCPATGSNVVVIPTVPPGNTGVLVTSPTPVGTIISIPIHPNMTRLRTLNASNTPSNFNVTFAIAKCPGDVQSTWLTSGAVPCRKQAGYTGNALDVTMAPTFAKCHWTAAQRTESTPYYMNIRVDSCDSGVCNFRYQQDY